jgi:hypothetical protein
VDVLEDRAPVQPESPLREELVLLFRRVFQSGKPLDPDFAELLEKPVPLGVLTDIIAHSLSLPPAVKQRLLGEVSIDRRVDSLRVILRQATPDQDNERPFPPQFSNN